ncbi:hypothetical protein AHAS_Ahas11G0129500 [Arachis hypogaea]
MEPSIFGARFLEIRNSNKKFNSIKVFVSSSSTWLCHFCSVKINGDVTILFFEFGQLEFWKA